MKSRCPSPWFATFVLVSVLSLSPSALGQAAARVKAQSPSRETFRAPSPEELEAAKADIGLPGPAELAERTAKARPQLPDRGLNHEKRQWVEQEIQPDGTTNVVTHEYVAMAPGLNFTNATGQLEAAVPEFVERKGYAVAERLQFQVRIAGSLNTAGGIQVTQSDGKVLRSHVAGLRYVDSATGKGVMLSEIQDSQAVILTTNQVIYPDAFERIKASIRYTVTVQGLEQDILLHEKPPGPEEFGLDPATTRLQVLTEFVDRPEPKVDSAPARGRLRGEGAEPEAALRGAAAPAVRPETADDVDLDFGAMRIGEGRAFSADGTDALPIRKEWQRLEGRDFLIENLEVQAAAPALERLAPPKGAFRSAPRRPGQPREREVAQRAENLVPAVRTQSKTQAAVGRPSRALLAQLAQPMFVLDYVQLVATTYPDFTFAGNVTYLIQGIVALTGHAVFEGGTVLKYPRSDWSGGGPNGAYNWVEVRGTSEFQTSAYRPAIFTAVDDHTVGEKIGNNPIAYLTDPNTRYGPHTLYFVGGSGPANIRHVRIQHMWYGVVCANWRDDNVLSHAQFRVVGPVYVSDAPTRLRVLNCLVEGGNYGLEALAGGRVTAEHLTVWAPYRRLRNEVAGNNPANAPAENVTLRNCLFVSVGDPGHAPAFADLGGNVTGAPGMAEFQAAAGGKFYLRAGSPHRNAGNPGIDPDLRADFADFTTDPPVALSGALANGSVLRPTVVRDTDVPDIGYHYPALDYVGQSLGVANGTVRLLDGVALGFSLRSAFELGYAGNLVSTGLPGRPNRLVRQSVVQEETVAGTVSSDAATFYVVAPVGGVPPGLELRFTELNALHWTDRRNDLLWHPPELGLTAVTFRDCQFGGIQWDYAPGPGGAAAPVSLLNNLFVRSQVSLQKRSNTNAYPGAALALEARNNLFWRSPLTLAYNAGTANPPWTLTDNVFHGTAPALTGDYLAAVAKSHNAFIGCADGGLSGIGNQSLSTLRYQAGPFGPWYQLDATLRNLGSRTAAAAGLFQHTTDPEQIKEAGTQVDLGFHYVASEAHRLSAQFSGTQGQNGWFYRMTSALQGPATNNIPTFGPLWSQFIWWDNTVPGGQNNADYYTMIAVGWMHPGATRDTVAEYQLPQAGRVWAAGWGRDIHSWAGGDGARARLALDGTTRLGWVDLPEWDGTANLPLRPLFAAIAGNAGQRVQFQLNCGPAGNGSDTTSWDPVIAYARPSDQDGDGFPDWFEDTNGNGSLDSGETDPATSNNGVTTSGAGALVVFTPLL
jgi:hypothetical protein